MEPANIEGFQTPLHLWLKAIVGLWELDYYIFLSFIILVALILKYSFMS